MQAKILEVRDRGTFIPMLCVDMNPHLPDDMYLLRRAGYVGMRLIMMCKAEGGGKAHCDPYNWGDRTYKVAHDYIEKHWNDLKSGDVIDVEFILGETTEKKVSEQWLSGLNYAVMLDFWMSVIRPATSDLWP